MRSGRAVLAGGPRFPKATIAALDSRIFILDCQTDRLDRPFASGPILLSDSRRRDERPLLCRLARLSQPIASLMSDAAGDALGPVGRIRVRSAWRRPTAEVAGSVSRAAACDMIAPYLGVARAWQFRYDLRIGPLIRTVHMG